MSLANLFVPNKLPVVNLNNQSGGVKYDGTLTASGASGVVRLDARSGVVTITGINSVASQGSVNLTILNDLVGGGSQLVKAQIIGQTGAAGSAFILYSAVVGSDLLIISLLNPTATATGAAGSVTIYFEIIN